MNNEYQPEDINKEEQEQLKLSAPVLHSMEKNNPFTVPDGYFDRLPAEIQEKISLRKEDPWFVLLLKGILRPQPAMVVLMLFVLVSIALYFADWQNHQSAEVVALDSADLRNAEIAFAIDESTLLDELANLDETDSYKGNETEIENYLIDNQTDLNQLINEL